jgi:hypothetical protein
VTLACRGKLTVVGVRIIERVKQVLDIVKNNPVGWSCYILPGEII